MAATSPRTRRRLGDRASQAVTCLLVLHAGLLAWSALRQSPTVDEWGHLAAGMMHWSEGRYDGYRVNPPLVRMVAALPVLSSWPDDPTSVPPASGYYRSETLAMVRLYLEYGKEVLRLFAVSRLACIPFSLLGGWVCYRWARELYGQSAGLAAATLWCFCPNVLAHGALITPDVGAASLGLTANYLFWCWLRKPAWSTTILVGAGFSAAMLTKFTWIILPPVWAILWVIHSRRSGLTRSDWGSQAAKLTTMGMIAFWAINSVYDWHGSFRPLGEYSFVSRALRKTDENLNVTATPEGNRFSGTFLGRLPVPLPEDFLLGIDRQKVYFEIETDSYLRGVWRGQSWWYYYLYAMSVKLPLGFWGLLLAAGTWTLVTAQRGRQWNEIFLLVPPLVLFVLVSSQTAFGRHLRYVLPCFPYLYIFSAKVFSPTSGCRGLPRRVCRSVLAGLVTWSVASSLWVFPHSLSYFNEFAGGPQHGYRHLLGSNFDWSQDLLFLRSWLNRHPEVELDGLAFTEDVVPRLIGLETPQAAPEPLPGWYVASLNRILLPDQKYRFFLEFEPVATVGYTMRVYHITLDEANRVRQTMGLYQLDAERRKPVHRSPKEQEGVVR